MCNSKEWFRWKIDLIVRAEEFLPSESDEQDLTVLPGDQ